MTETSDERMTGRGKASAKPAAACAVAALAILLIAAPLEAAKAETYRIKQGVSQGYQNMRSGPGQGHAVVAQIPAGTGGIQAAGECEQPDDAKSRFAWCRYSWDGLTGWMSSNGVELAAGASDGSDGADDEDSSDEEQMLECVCGPWFYKICLDPDMGEDGPFPIRDGIQFRGPGGFASALRGGEGQRCNIPRP